MRDTTNDALMNLKYEDRDPELQKDQECDLLLTEEVKDNNEKN
jgi:hypothetical protein